MCPIECCFTLIRPLHMHASTLGHRGAVSELEETSNEKNRASYPLYTRSVLSGVKLSTSTVYVMCNTMEHQSYVHALETSCMPQQRGTHAGAHQMSHLAIPRGERLRQCPQGP
jgi:hypothetical protein